MSRHFDRSKRKDFIGKIDSVVQVLSNIKPYFKIFFGNTLSNSIIFFLSRKKQYSHMNLKIIEENGS